jgi:FimV-like protein
MLSLIIKSYLTILISVSAFSLFVFVLGLMWIVRSKGPDKKINKDQLTNEIHTNNLGPDHNVSVNDLESIAGDDCIATQLDLARAYIETGRLKSAKKILDLALKQGTDLQKREAQELLLTLSL